jgi:ABC-2 type transport system permease protein
MATHSTAIPSAHSEKARASGQSALDPGIVLPSTSLWWREIVRFYRMRSRVVGVIASPLLFWIVIGSGFGNSFRAQTAGGGQRYLEFFFPGALIMIVLFTSIFTMMSVIEDRREGFLLSVLVAPISRSVIVLGKVLGGTTLATIQGLIFLAFAPLIGIHFSLLRFVAAVLCVLLVSFSLTALGFIVAWRLDSTQAFHAIINLFLMPLWMLSGSLFPVSGASSWIALIMRANPLTYGVEALRASLYPQVGNGLGLSTVACLLVLGTFALMMFGIAFAMVNRRRATPSA